MKPRIDYSVGLEIASDMVKRISPHVERVSIVGSLRRGLETVGDIDLVVLPHQGYQQDMFGEGKSVADQRGLMDVLREGEAKGDWVIEKAGEKLKVLWLPIVDVAIDINVVVYPASWGVIKAIKTGPQEFSKFIVTPRKWGGALPSNLKVKDGAVWRGKKRIETQTERSFFVDVLGYEFPPHPEDRGLEIATLDGMEIK